MSFSLVVGPSGAAKTTLAGLVIGLFQLQKGEVTMDDLPLSQVDMRSRREMFGYVPRETLLVNEIAWTRVGLEKRTIAGEF
jgi:ABC-type bacteriocin/lantibiotic exporter with double-glycine peptidase domain